jgi:2-dehydropantoate 2-reductase
MRILVVGAGAIGGYFGARLLAAKQDVTFLVRSRRAAELASSGLELRSPNGDLAIPNPPTVLAENLHSGYDLILLSCKAYDLDGAIASIAPAVTAETAILPLLNGMRHLDVLEQRFGSEHVLGGLCMISSTLEAGGRIAHFTNFDTIIFGERDGSHTARAEAIAKVFASAHFGSRLSQSILQEMWEKWTFIATLAGITCLMRAATGDILASGHGDLTLALFDECRAISASHGFAYLEEPLRQNRAILTKPGSPLVASMLRDVERNSPTEADHIIGDLLRRGQEKSLTSPVLQMAYAHLQSYAVRRARETTASQG